MTVRFGSTGSTYIRNPEWENSEEIIIKSKADFTPAGVFYSYKKHEKITIFNLKFANLIQQERDELQDFFDGQDGPSDSFVYRDHHGDTFTVVFRNDRLVWVNVFDMPQTEVSYFDGGIERFYPANSKICNQYNVEIKLEVLL